MEIAKTNLEGVLLIKPDIFKDYRGEFVEIYNEELYAKHGITVKFLQDDISLSHQNVLRGIHGDEETWKLISCLYGEVYDVVVDCRKQSSHFGEWQSFLLSGQNCFQVLVPPGCGNSHLVLSQEVIFHYKQSTYYDPKRQFTFKYNDPRFNISWPIQNPILSKRDELGHFV
jgi:dTDP-4-dehydrorhamnose 3,5-epimerase